VNLRGPFFLMQAVVRLVVLSERSGVVTGSVLDWDQIVFGAHD
jgi:NAD(P)-dependent dehydrogenase (short-subunit alcohol dehydrogenase family)